MHLGNGIWIVNNFAFSTIQPHFAYSWDNLVKRCSRACMAFGYSHICLFYTAVLPKASPTTFSTQWYGRTHAPVSHVIEMKKPHWKHSTNVLKLTFSHMLIQSLCKTINHRET